MTRAARQDRRKGHVEAGLQARSKAAARRLRALGVRAVAGLARVTLEVHVAEDLVSRLEDLRRIEDRGHV